MRPLEELLILYKALLTQEVDREGLSPVRIDVRPGDVCEIVPSYDALEQVFLVLREVNRFYEVVPLSPFYEFATPSDVLIKVNGRPYIAQTDISFGIPVQDFSLRFPEARIVKVGEVPQKTLEKIIKVTEGKERGDGKIKGGIKGEFKIMEAKRWLDVFKRQIAYEEFSSLVEALKDEELSLAASEEESLFGENEYLSWLYDEDRKNLVLVPRKEFVGKGKVLYLDLEGKEFVLFVGKLPERMEIPLKSYNHKVFKKRLRIKDV